MGSHIGGSPAPGGTFAAVVDEIVPGSTVSITAANTVVHNKTVTLPGSSTKIKVTWSARLWSSNAPGGPYAAVVIKLDGSVVFPRGPTSGNTFSQTTAVETTQQNVDEVHTFTMWITGLAAGSHTVQLLLSNNIGSTGTLAYDWSVFSLEFYP